MFLFYFSWLLTKLMIIFLRLNTPTKEENETKVLLFFNNTNTP